MDADVYDTAAPARHDNDRAWGRGNVSAGMWNRNDEQGCEDHTSYEDYTPGVHVAP